MTIGSTIKKLRRERDITQEQLAEYLGITASAISQWETDRVMPDVTQLPILANIFEVSTDVLLGVDVENKQKAIDKILDEAYKHMGNGYYSRAEDILREGLRQYPMSHWLMDALLSTISRYPYDNNDNTRYDEIQNEIINIGTKLLTESINSTIRNGAVQILCYTYPRLGKTDEAIRLAKSMPGMCQSCETLLTTIYKGNKCYEQSRDNLVQHLNGMIGYLSYNRPLDDEKRPYTPEEVILIKKKVIDLIKLIIDDGNYGYFMQHIAWTYLEIAEIYADMKDNTNVLQYLEKAKNMSVASDTEYVPDKEYTCLILRSKRFGGVSHNITDNDSLHQLEAMKDGRFDFIRNSNEFIAIEKSLNEIASKH